VLFDLKSSAGVRLKIGNACISPLTDFIALTLVVSFQTILISSPCKLYTSVVKTTIIFTLFLLNLCSSNDVEKHL
jgi:hypothetical protein